MTDEKMAASDHGRNDVADKTTANALAAEPTPLYFEDYTQDFKVAGGEYHVTEDEVLEFGRRFDPQPFHTDKEAAARSHFGGLIAPGCLTFAIRSALYNQLPVRPRLVAGLGLDSLELTTPVRPGDILSLEVRVDDARRSKSRPGTGVVTTKQSVSNQRGETVLSMLARMIVEARSESDSV